ncbi:NAD(P)-dependent oxidoreductase [Saccharibacillus sp. CPCC 101409]|uniref:NAD(P)-dependent oxidoreductase n=1 Tax=Saccharibacillus sp. CPCC 101409 TaxID=3058041 RepID=UPI0026717087|nr:NAD(P)-dependent oxidoreductase [Saccharibacillus sp. CPCC 101409]MDO3410858.1 NAD(P)-dependent oxidoreductase [Saccharibacillus sp. CPCC 101409]
MEQLAWIGTGYMGLPMARNLLKAGYPLRAFNRTAAKAEPLADHGVELAQSPRAACEGAKAVFVMLTKGSAVEDVLNGADGVLAGLGAGALVVNMSTIAPDEAREFARLTEEAGGVYVDAPVSGSVGPAENGQLVILAGGDEQAVDACKPYFEILGKKTIRFGEAGAGSSAKLSINLLLGVMAQGISEALLIGEHAGLDRAQLIEMIGESAVNTPMLAGKKDMWMNEEFPAAFMVSLLSKDLGLLAAEARREQIDLPLAEAVNRTYASAVQSGLDEQDMAAIWTELKRRMPERKQ